MWNNCCDIICKVLCVAHVITNNQISINQVGEIYDRLINNLLNKTTLIEKQCSKITEELKRQTSSFHYYIFQIQNLALPIILLCCPTTSSSFPIPHTDCVFIVFLLPLQNQKLTFIHTNYTIHLSQEDLYHLTSIFTTFNLSFFLLWQTNYYSFLWKILSTT